LSESLLIKLLPQTFSPHGTSLYWARASSLSRLHDQTRVGFLWTRDRPLSENSTWQHTTLTRDRHPCPWQDSNP